jgi:uncharacterized protein YlxP (DUF503 family)
MNVGVCKVTLRLPENQSLKGKRRVIGSLCSRIHNKFNVSVAEVGDNDSWQTATLGVACATNNGRHADEVLSSVVAFIESSREDLELVAHEQETISGF